MPVALKKKQLAKLEKHVVKLVKKGEPKKAIKELAAELPSVNEKGSFAHGTCPMCDWKGPGRRARDKARDDATAHLLTHRGTKK